MSLIDILIALNIFYSNIIEVKKCPNSPNERVETQETNLLARKTKERTERRQSQ